MALEDRRFWQHPGVDPVAIARAAWSRLHGGRSGASTIAMQVARDAAVDPAGPARRYGLGLAVGAGDGARLVAGFLSDPMARLPSFPRYGPSEYPFTVALKTGTSQ